MKVVRNCVFALKLVFRYAPWNGLLFMAGCLIPGFFMGLQVILVQRVVDGGISYVNTGEGLESLVVSGITLVVMLFSWTVFQQLLSMYERKVLEARMTRCMAPDILEKLDRLEYGSFESEEVQSVLQRVSGEPWNNMVNCFTSTIISLQDMISILFTLGVYMSISVWVGIGLLLITVPMLIMKFSATQSLQKIIFSTTGEMRRLRDLKQLLQNKHAMYEMKVFESQPLLSEKWKEACRKVEAQTRQAGSRVIGLEGGSSLLSLVYFLFLIAALVYSLLLRTVTLGQFIAAVGSIGAVTGRMNGFSWQLSSTISYSLDIEFYREFMDLPERKDIGTVETLLHGDIAFENVSFSYPGTDRQVLKNITFRIKEGERIAFVGENGAGKSTIIKLLCGLYAPDSGRVLIGGVNVRDLSPGTRRKMLSAVFQDFQEYELTLRENVAFGDISRLEDEPALRDVLSRAGARELLRPEEGGLDHPLGHLEETGRDLSRGQWQRVAVARAFLADAAFCILDEPTASLDPIAESRMYQNFANVYGRGTGTIMISHRLASAKMADRILVLDGGHVVQNGSHEQLMKEDGLYRSMYLRQSSWYHSSEKDSRTASVMTQISPENMGEGGR